jgi:HSP20 family protein
MLARWNDFGRFGRFNPREFAAPVDLFDQLHREMNRLFFDFERGGPERELEATGSPWPRFSFEDTGSALVIRADVPGLSEKDLALTLEGSTLTVKGERSDVSPEGHSVHRKERRAYKFSRSFSLPTPVDVEKPQAVLKHGVLTVTLHKAKEAQPRQISVTSSG